MRAAVRDGLDDDEGGDEGPEADGEDLGGAAELMGLCGRLQKARVSGCRSCNWLIRQASRGGAGGVVEGEEALDADLLRRDVDGGAQGGDGGEIGEGEAIALEADRDDRQHARGEIGPTQRAGTPG